MRVVIQRVKSSQVSVNGEVIGKIGRGLNLLVGISESDTETELEWIARKCLELRLFPESEGNDRWQKSIQDIQGELLVISQFTLYGDCRKGRRPSFDRSAKPEVAEGLYNKFVEQLRRSGLWVETGKFGAMMEVAMLQQGAAQGAIANDGPVTLILDK
jgi:D-tyrosyl-tRNA(Tyr) deacylase